MSGRSLRLLIADDSPSDINLFKMALRNHPTTHEVYTVPDGEAVLDFLWRRGTYADAPIIDLLLLDINMPKRTGHEVLQDLKADPNLRSLPVLMLTSSVSERDITRAYALHANCYIQNRPTWIRGLRLCMPSKIFGPKWLLFHAFVRLPRS